MSFTSFTFHKLKKKVAAVVGRTADWAPGHPAARRTSRHASGCRITDTGPRCRARSNGHAGPRWRSDAAAGPSRCRTDARPRHSSSGDADPWSTGRNASCWRARSRNSGCAAPGRRPPAAARGARRCRCAEHSPGLGGRNAAAQPGAIRSADGYACLPGKADSRRTAATSAAPAAA